MQLEIIVLGKWIHILKKWSHLLILDCIEICNFTNYVCIHMQGSRKEMEEAKKKLGKQGGVREGRAWGVNKVLVHNTLEKDYLYGNQYYTHWVHAHKMLINRAREMAL